MPLERLKRLVAGSRFLRFALVGGVTALIYFSVLYVLVGLLNTDIVLSSSAAYILASMFNYCMHYVWTFESNQRHQLAISRYLVMCIVGFFINYTIMYLGSIYMEAFYLLVQAFAVMCILLWNFVIGSIWVYKSRA